MQSLKCIGNYLMRELSHSNVQQLTNSSKVLFSSCSNCRNKGSSVSKEFMLPGAQKTVTYTSKTSELESGAVEERAFPLGYNRRVLLVIFRGGNSSNIQHVNNGLTKKNLDCLSVDFSCQDYDSDRYSPTIRNQNEEFLREISAIKPEVIFVDHIQESQYLMQTKGTLRTLGYTGHLSGLKKGRGRGIFVRKDIAESMHDAHVSDNIAKMFNSR